MRDSNTQPEYSQPEAKPPKTRGEVWEGVAFSWCKAATILLLITALQLGKFALPVISGVTAILFVATYFAGQKTSRCILKKPLWIAAFWGAISVLSLWILLRAA
jgi:hypothetical protein